MGTRNLTIVQKNGEYKVAQYGQWDGMPNGNGLKVLGFARNLSNLPFRNEFDEKVAAASYFTKNEIEDVYQKIREGTILDIENEYPQLCRNMGAGVLEFVCTSSLGVKLGNDINFAADSLFCEWAWVIDLDNNTFEGYKGFNDSNPLTPDDRFYFLRDKEKDGYHAIRLIAKWELNNLPSNNDFLATFDIGEE